MGTHPSIQTRESQYCAGKEEENKFLGNKTMAPSRRKTLGAIQMEHRKKYCTLDSVLSALSLGFVRVSVVRCEGPGAWSFCSALRPKIQQSPPQPSPRSAQGFWLCKGFSPQRRTSRPSCAKLFGVLVWGVFSGRGELEESCCAWFGLGFVVEKGA